MAATALEYLRAAQKANKKECKEIPEQVSAVENNTVKSTEAAPAAPTKNEEKAVPPKKTNNPLKNLFAEQVRLDEERAKLKEEKEQLAKDREDLDYMKRSIDKSYDKLLGEQRVFRNKLDILYEGFEKLNADKKQLESERKALAEHNPVLGENRITFFAGVTNMIALRKRYAELLKIYHPDNDCGDKYMTAMIVMEYKRLLPRFETAGGVVTVNRQKTA